MRDARPHAGADPGETADRRAELAKFSQRSADGGLTHAQLRGRGADTAVPINLCEYRKQGLRSGKARVTVSSIAPNDMQISVSVRLKISAFLRLLVDARRAHNDPGWGNLDMKLDRRISSRSSGAQRWLRRCRRRPAPTRSNTTSMTAAAPPAAAATSSPASAPVSMPASTAADKRAIPSAADVEAQIETQPRRRGVGNLYQRRR